MNSRLEVTVPEKFEPVTTLEELDSFDSNQIVQGYMLGCKGYPEPETSINKAVWHGWRNGMIDTKRMQADEAYYSLARLIVERSRQKNQPIKFDMELQFPMKTIASE